MTPASPPSASTMTLSHVVVAVDDLRSVFAEPAGQVGGVFQQGAPVCEHIQHVTVCFGLILPGSDTLRSRLDLF